MVENRSRRPPAPLSHVITNSGATSASGTRYFQDARAYPHPPPAPSPMRVAMHSLPRTHRHEHCLRRVRCICVRPYRVFRRCRCRARPDPTSAKVQNGGVQLATRFSETSFSPHFVHMPPIRPWTNEGSKTVFRKPPRQLHRAAPHCLWRRRHAESEPFRRLCGGRGVTIVHDLRDVTSVTSHTQTHENRMTSGGGRVTACICVNGLQRFLSGGSCFHDTDDFPLRLATGVFNLVCALHAAADGSEVESDRGE